MAAICLVILWVPITLAAEKGPFRPDKKDKCPVCGMFVARYPDWGAEIIFKDGSVVFFDGAKDLFKYYFSLKRYDSKKNRADVEAIYVTEYYDMKLIDAYAAYFVIGSDVYGPMGRELIPFVSEEDARAFMKDHRGKRTLLFEDVKPSVINKLD